jgi:hypothetical protein
MRLVCVLFGLMTILPLKSGAQPKKNAFGDSIPISNGLVGKIYLLPDTTTMLPEFDTMPALKTLIYAKSIDIPDRDWSEGFPGLRDRFEYFGIRYRGNFQVLKEGRYNFRLISDDGSKLIIDDSMVVNNDGVHGDDAISGNIFLKNGIHTIRLDYFQGPRFEIALQLYYNLDSAEEQIFPGNMFLLFTPKPFHWCPWLLLLLVIILILIWYLRKKYLQKRIA